MPAVASAGKENSVALPMLTPSATAVEELAGLQHRLEQAIAIDDKADVFRIVKQAMQLAEEPVKRNDALNQFCHHMMMCSHLQTSCRRIHPKNEVAESVHILATLALQCPPEGVCRILRHVAARSTSKYQMSRPSRGAGSGGRCYPANMALFLACVIDRIVCYERRTATTPDDAGAKLSLESALAPVVYDVVFRRWVLGAVAGSQFLANLLLTWERLGYFRRKYLDQCRQKVKLLVAYARADGVPDSDKEKGAGWYKIVQRPVGTIGCEAIEPSSSRPGGGVLRPDVEEAVSSIDLQPSSNDQPQPCPM